MTFSCVEPWSPNPEQAVEQAIRRFALMRLGWQGFDALDWVAELYNKYPVMREIVYGSSIIHGVRLEELLSLLGAAKSEDLPFIKSYFIGKLALEELSCRRNGAGAGSCDKKAALMQIFQKLNSLVA